MLKNEILTGADLEEAKWSLEEYLPSNIIGLFSEDDTITEIHYPVEQYPTKIKSLSFDKTSSFTKKLIGIKGQYLLFEGGGSDKY